MDDKFRRFAHSTATAAGSPWTFLLACFTIVLWLGTGPMFHFSDTWQLIINTGTTIITFLMVFLIQNTQNRDARAFHLKLDELLRGVKGARTDLVDLEDLSDEEMALLQKEFERVREEATRKKGKTSTTVQEGIDASEVKARSQEHKGKSNQT